MNLGLRSLSLAVRASFKRRRESLLSGLSGISSLRCLAVTFDFLGKPAEVVPQVKMQLFTIV